jgi:hypothetical protein
MDEEPTVSSNDDRDHVFEWLAHDTAPPADTHPEDADRPAHGPGNRSTRVPPAHTHARLDPLTVQGVINRVLVLVFCLIAVGATYEAFAAVSSSRTTSVVPSLLPSTTTVPKVAATVAPKPTRTTPAPTTTAPPVTTPTTAVPVTTPRTTPQTTPRTTPRTSPPATFHPVVAQTTPHTTPQTIRVPATTPTTAPSGPSDTVVVPFK